MPKVKGFETSLPTEGPAAKLSKTMAEYAQTILSNPAEWSASEPSDNLSQHIGQTELLSGEARLAAQRLYNRMYGTEVTSPEMEPEPIMGFKGDMTASMQRAQSNIIYVLEVLRMIARELEDER